MFADIRIAFRSLVKSPGFTAVALLTLALGIGVNTSMLSLVRTLLYGRMPFPESHRLINLFAHEVGRGFDALSAPEIADLRAQAKSLESLTTFIRWDNDLAEPGQPAERLTSLDASADVFKTFHLTPALGRSFTPEEEKPGRNQVALLSYDLWQSRFGGSSEVLGRTVRLNAEAVTIIGVMPPDASYPTLWGKVDLWRPVTVPQPLVQDREYRLFQAVARLKPGVTVEQAGAELAAISAHWAKEFPNSSAGRATRVKLLGESMIGDRGRNLVWMIFGLSGFVLLIACANLANLQLARATLRMKELAVRSALGASRRRLVAEQLTESLLLAFAGGALGVLLASWLNAYLRSAFELDGSHGPLLMLDARVLLGALAASALTGVLFGLAPAWLASKTDVSFALKQHARTATSGRGSKFLRQALIAGEIALAFTLLGGASAMIRGFRALLNQDNGWDTKHIAAAVIHLPEQSRYDTDEKRRIVIAQLEERLARVPGVEHTAIGTHLPLFDYSTLRAIQIEGQTTDEPANQPEAGVFMVTPDYFETLGIPLLEGRRFPTDTRPNSPPWIVIGETMARQFWPDRSAIGQRVGMREGDQIVWREVIGVVRDVGFVARSGPPQTMLQVYKPLVQEPWGLFSLIIRAASPESFVSELRRVMADVDPDVAVEDIHTFPTTLEQSMGTEIVINQILSGFAALGLVLGALGLYGVISNLVAQRTGEFGIRLALGANTANLLTLVLSGGLKLTLAGLALGAIGAYAVNRLLGSMIWRKPDSDPAALAVVAAILFVVALLACWLPARRATKVDPITALRAE
jgi:putative ABC transport system permease protein